MINFKIIQLKKILKKIIPLKFHSILRQIYSFIDYITFKNEIKNQFFKIHGYRLNLKAPKSFSEKIIWKKLFDRNPLIPLTTDKYRVRQYIEDKLGKYKAKEHLIPLLYVTDNPETIPFDDLPDEYILKPNHGVDRYIISENYKENKVFIIKDSRKKYTLTDSEDSRIEIINICKGWINTVFGVSKKEWGYSKIKPLIIIEKLLRENGKIPNDYKFHMFHGKCRTILVCTERLSNLGFIYYDKSWNILPVMKKMRGQQVEKPKVLEDILLIAEKLSEDFDFVRIDFYLVKNKIYCGEITHYPRSGLDKFTPTEYDFELGKYWKIDSKNFWCNRYYQESSN